ncbi:TonB-dependent receptor [Fulvivirgaceae bacterium PWU5]|uniref:TonB-dependent receptor n=1 Tax=Dawidia cretensis TaxID=2782350 RepID=A0AAP2E1P4_9BACT|nr:TonB-dependent receptor [Dawidia cretensis]MBT1710027.1 TonB-dependent receptor [Dawidia cretensis]
MNPYPHVKRWVSRGSGLILLCLVVTLHGNAQNKVVTGTVKDTDGVQMPGVSIFEKGTSNGTTSDVDGKFSLSVSPGAVLTFTFIGMAVKDVEVGNQTSLDVVLDHDVSQLDEVVVIGYGTAKKSDLTGSVVSVTGDALRKVPLSNVAETLTGRMAGVQVTSTEGSPDADIRIRVRGGGSITQDNSPLYIVDGFQVNSISDISPSDIQSIDVLKDASSTAIYGSRGANGVIIITTKSGKPGKVSVSYNTFYGAKRIANTLDVLPVEDYVKWQYEYAVLDNDPGELESYEDYFGTWADRDLFTGMKGNNWQEQVYGRTGHVFSHDVSVRGGGDKFSYSANYALYDEKAIMIGSDFRRNNLTMKFNSKPAEPVELTFSLRYSDTKIEGSGANEQNEVSASDSRLKHAVTYSPIPLAGLTNDDTNEEISSYLINPIIATNDNAREQNRKNYTMVGSVAWNILDNLQFRSEIGLDNVRSRDNRFYGLTTYYVQNAPSAENQDHPAVIITQQEQTRIRNANTLNYNFKGLLGPDHNLNLLLGHETIRTENTLFTSIVHGFPTLFTADQAFKLTTQGKSQTTNNFLSPDDKLLSFFGRANYEFKGKYLLSATYRADGSSRFMDGNRWGYFPSAAAAWKISSEEFMAGTSRWLDQLKLRVSYGVAGNNNIPVGQTVQSFESNTNTWINGFSSYWSASKFLANPDLKWETTHTRNIGLDFSTLQGRVSGTVDVYKNNTTDLLVEFPVPGTGYTSQFRNLGETENKGLETSLKYIVVEKPNYGFDVSVNISFNRNNVKSLGMMENFGRNTNWASTEIGNDFLIERGKPVGMMYGYVSDGRYEVSDFEGYDAATNTWIPKAGLVTADDIVGKAAPGMMKLKDVKTDGIITIDDRGIIGNANPKHTGGIILNGYVYGFDLTAAFSWSYGNDIYNANKIEYTSSSPRYQYRNLSTIMADGQRWTNIDPTNGNLITDPASLASLNANTTMWSPYMDRFVFSDWAVEDGSFLRLNTLTLGYTVPSSLTNRLHIQSLRLYATAYNVFILTDYTGFDPEVSTRRNTALTPGVDYSAYPRSRQLVFGLNLNF